MTLKERCGIPPFVSNETIETVVALGSGAVRHLQGVLTAVARRYLDHTLALSAGLRQFRPPWPVRTQVMDM